MIFRRMDSMYPAVDSLANQAKVVKKAIPPVVANIEPPGGASFFESGNSFPVFFCARAVLFRRYDETEVPELPTIPVAAFPARETAQFPFYRAKFHPSLFFLCCAGDAPTCPLSGRIAR